MKKFVLFLIFSFSTFFSFSQYIEGKVLDAQTNNPIEGVNVYMKGINRGTVTNEKGIYYLKFPYEIVKNDIIRFSHVAYKELEVPYIQKKKNYSVNLLIDLKKLDEVNVSINRNLKKTISYKKLSSMKNAVHSFGSCLKDGKIYIVGGDVSFDYNNLKKILDNDYQDPDRMFEQFIMNGHNYNKEGYSGDLQTYDIDDNIWIKSKSIFKKRAYHNLNYYNNKIYVLGGKNISANGKFEYLENKIEIFDLDKKSITVDETNPHQAADFASFTYNDNLIVLGGSLKKKFNENKEYSNKFHLYNLKSGLWYELATMPIAKEVNGVLIDDTIYLIGGFKDKPLNSIEKFNITTGKWIKEGELFYGISKPSIASNETIIYFFEGGKIFTYNTITKELNEYFIELDIVGAQLFYSNNKLYILGGFKTTSYFILPKSGLFSIDINEFNTTKVQQSKVL